ncbi:uncharacterized protein LOC141626905 isoform X2 [Silene latifolia]
MPLGPSRYVATIFDPLITKIQYSIQHWTTNLLSYAGKIQLINAVVFGLENFWCSSCLVPKEVVKKINRLCKKIFGGIPEGNIRIVFQRWANICAPWDRGGFNIKDLEKWNITLPLNWTRSLSADGQGLWVKCHQAYVLKQDSIWTVQSKAQYSSSFKGILAARDYLIAKAGSLQAAKFLLNSCITDQKLHFSKLYDYLIVAPVQEDWYSVLLHPKIIPSHRIITSLAVQLKLATVDNLQVRGFHLANRCCLCKQAQENHQHLFFGCPFSMTVWSGLLSWLRLSHQPRDLVTELQWIHQQADNKDWITIWFKITLVAAVYKIWHERKSRIFHQKESLALAIINDVKFVVSVRMYMLSKHKHFSSMVGSLCT